MIIRRAQDLGVFDAPAPVRPSPANSLPPSRTPQPKLDTLLPLVAPLVAVGLTFVILTAEIDLSVAAVANAIGITVAYFTIQPDYVNIANLPLIYALALLLGVSQAFEAPARIVAAIEGRDEHARRGAAAATDTPAQLGFPQSACCSSACTVATMP